MKVIIILIFAGFVNSQMSFKQWQKTFKIYKNVYSRLLEQQAFDMNCAFINACNSKFGKNFQLGLNEFSSLTFSQFETKYLGLVVPTSSSGISKVTYEHSGVLARAIGITQKPKPVPDSIDYRRYSLTVQNQKFCGSCWAFAAISTLGRKSLVCL
jgi:hypothetical protein